MRIVKKILTTKFMVAASLVVSFLGMFIIIGIGIFQPDGPESASGEESSEVDQLDNANNISSELVSKLEGVNGAPSITLTAMPATVAVGGSSTLDWVVDKADVCAAFGGWSGVKSNVGNQKTAPLAKDTSFSLTCTNARGSTTVKAKIKVSEYIAIDVPNETETNGNKPPENKSSNNAVAPVVSISANPSSITSGASSNISWSVNSSASPTPTCTASGAWSGSKSTSGSTSVSPSTGSHTYTLKCTNSAGSNTKSATLTVSAPPSSCGSGGSCTSAEVAAHNTQNDCWTIINGNVYKITSTFQVTTHKQTLGGPDLIGGKTVCGLNKTNKYNDKHSGGSRTGGGYTADWWLTGNGNLLIGPWSGS